MGNIGRLRYLVLSSKMLSGEIPDDQWRTTTILKLLYLQNNMLSGA